VATWTERTEAIAPVAVIKLVGATNWFIRVRFPV
jgi:cell division protein FtsX